MSRRDVPGHLYLVHLDPPLKHAKHYLGFAEGSLDDLADRLAEHGGSHGARLLAAQKAAGGSWHLVRTWEGTRRTERAIKNTRHVPHYCPDCQPERSAARRQARQQQKEPEMNRSTENPQPQQPTTTVGDLIRGMQRGEISREQVKAAIAPLDIIHWGIEVPVPEPESAQIEDVDQELEAG